MASGSFKDTAKALNAVFANQTHVQDLTKETQQVVDAYLEKHQEKDEYNTQRLQDELKAIYTKFVAREEGNLVAFLQLLKAMRPGINTLASLQEWWTLVFQPTIDGLGHTRSEISHASDCLLDILDYDSESDRSGEDGKISSHFVSLLLEAYLRRTRIHDVEGEVLSNEDDFIAQQLSNVLVAYGRKKPKEFMVAVDHLFIIKDQRMQALALISTFVQSQPPHLYLVRDTPLFKHLLQCLLLDTSTTVISLALTVLIMFLPHIPSSVRKHLPRLFLIYSRLLCWERYRPSNSAADKQSIIEEEDEESENDEIETTTEPVAEETWDRLESSFENAESTTPELLHYFTFLYGLYPLNFTSYIRKPRTYLKSINFPRADEFDLDQKTIRLRTEQFSRLHLLHPSFTNTTLKDEFEENRWMKTDPVDVVAECIGLCLTTLDPMVESTPSTVTKPAEIPPAYVKTEDIPSESLLGYSDDALVPSMVETPLSSTESGPAPGWRAAITQATLLHRTTLQNVSTPSHSSVVSSPVTSITRPRGRDESGDSPTLGAAITPILRASSRPGRHGSIVSLHSANDPSPRMSAVQLPTRDEMPRSPALRPAGLVGEGNLAFLQREVTLLKNDLKFERYLKQQHMTHIGQLQRKHIKEATVEAETQNLINNNRTLKTKLAEANKAYVLLKKEAATNRSQSKKYEAELSVKVRGLKEDERQWRAEEEVFRADLAKAQSERDQLRQLVVTSEAKELLTRQEVASATLKLEQLESLYKRVQELEAKVQAYETRELDFEQAHDEREILTTELATANLRLQSRDADYERERKAHNRHLQDLEAKLHMAQNPTAGGTSGQIAPAAQLLIDQAVAAHKAKYATLKKTHVKLQHRFLELEIRCKDLEQAAVDAAAAATAEVSSADGRGSFSSRHQFSPSSAFDAAFDHAHTNTNASASRNSSFTRHTPIPIPSPHHHQHNPLSSSASSATATTTTTASSRPRPVRPANAPGLEFNQTMSSVSTPPQIPPFPSIPYTSSTATGRSAASSRTMHRTGADGRTTSPTVANTTGTSIRASRANSSFDSTRPTVGSSNSGNGTGAARGGSSTDAGAVTGAKATGNSFYSQSISAFSSSSLDSVDPSSSNSRGGGGAKSSKKKAAAEGGEVADGKYKIGAKSDVRVYGRGGAQNIGKNKENKDDANRKDKREKSKPGGLLGIRGIL